MATGIYTMPNPFTVDGFLTWFADYAATKLPPAQAARAREILTNPAFRPIFAPVAQRKIDADHRAILDAIAAEMRARKIDPGEPGPRSNPSQGAAVQRAIVDLPRLTGAQPRIRWTMQGITPDWDVVYLYADAANNLIGWGYGTDTVSFDPSLPVGGAVADGSQIGKVGGRWKVTNLRPTYPHLTGPRSNPSHHDRCAMRVDPMLRCTCDRERAYDANVKMIEGQWAWRWPEDDEWTPVDGTHHTEASARAMVRRVEGDEAARDAIIEPLDL